MKPVIMRMVVDLPAPFGPRKPEHFAALDGERNAVHGALGAECFTKFSTLIMVVEPLTFCRLETA